MKTLPLTATLIFLATTAASNEVQFKQASGATVSLSITQSNGTGHRVIGLDEAGTLDSTEKYRISGTFDSVTVTQSSTKPTTVGGDVVTSEGLSTIDHMLGGSGAHSVVLDADVGELDSQVDLLGSGSTSVNLTANATGGAVSHSLRIDGGSSTISVDQSTTSTLTADLMVMGNDAVANFNLSGESSSTDVNATLGDNATLNVNQSGFNSMYALEAYLGADSELTVNQSANGAVTSDTGDIAISVPDGMTVSLFRNGNGTVP